MAWAIRSKSRRSISNSPRRKMNPHWRLLRMKVRSSMRGRIGASSAVDQVEEQLEVGHPMRLRTLPAQHAAARLAIQHRVTVD